MRDKLAILLPTAIIILAEVLFYERLAEASLELHLLNIFICIMLSIFLAKGQELYLAFVMVSLLRVLNIGMPTFFSLSLWFFPFIYLPIIFTVFVIWYVDNVPEGQRLTLRSIWLFLNGSRADEPSHFRWVFIPIAALIGLGMSFVEFFVLHPQALVPDLSALNLVALMVVMVLFVGLGEELVFRGILQTRVQERAGPVIAILFSSFLFAIMHYSSLPYLIYVFGVGLLLGYSYYRTKNLLFVVLIHGFINFFLFSSLPYWL
jgi:membrane protease YdiL (CAAX protease family)